MEVVHRDARICERVPDDRIHELRGWLLGAWLEAAHRDPDDGYVHGSSNSRDDAS
jgi:hypothetical protein